MTIPSFVYATFITQYPMYAVNPTQAILTNLWNEVDTIGTPIISTLIQAKQEYYYYVVEAHLAELWLRGPGANGITSASQQDSVTVTFEIDKANSLLFWNQTSWGAKIAQLIKMRGGFTFICGGNNYYDRYS